LAVLEKREGMKITPVDIQQQQFAVRLRGFDMVEVDKFLDLLANEIDELLQENNKLKDGEQQKAEKIQKLERAESELRDAFISAQQIFDELKNNARKEADLIIEEAKASSRKILETAQTQARHMEGEISPLRRQRVEVEAALKGILEMHRKLVESYSPKPISPGSTRAE
jgi:cell division initiation protein